MDRSLGAPVHRADPFGPRAAVGCYRGGAAAGCGRRFGCDADSIAATSSMTPRNLSATLVTLVIGVAIPRPAVSQNRWEREVHGRLQRAVNAVTTHSSGSPVLTKTGTLNEEEAETFLVTLERGVAYSILG